MKVALVGLLFLLGLLVARVLTVGPGALPPVPTGPAVVTRQLAPDLLVHAIRTGWVMVKTEHRALTWPDTLRVPAILLDGAWTEWMPVTVYAIEHPEGVFLLDAGLSEESLDPAHFDCDPGTRWVYANLLRFALPPEERIDRQLARLGITPARLRGVVLTHRHADHADALRWLPDVPVYVGEGDWPSHNGALPCRWPEGRSPVLVGAQGEPFGAFPHSTPLTQDGRLRVIPLPGHSPGHLGALLAGENAWALFVGDAAFDLGQVRHTHIAGITERPSDARESLAQIAAQLRSAPTYLLPAHDPASLARFARDESPAESAEP